MFLLVVSFYVLIHMFFLDKYSGLECKSKGERCVRYNSTLPYYSRKNLKGLKNVTLTYGKYQCTISKMYSISLWTLIDRLVTWVGKTTHKRVF